MKTTLRISALYFFVFLASCSPSGILTKVNSYREAYKNRISPGNIMMKAEASYTVEMTPEQYYIKKEYFFETGQKTTEITYYDLMTTIPEGKATEWYDNGYLWSEGNYKNGKKDGAWKIYSYRRKGQMESQGSYITGLQDGLWTTYDTLGNKFMEIWYKTGKAVGDPVFYNPDGSEKTGSPKEFAGSIDDIDVHPNYPCDTVYAATGDQCGENSLMRFLQANIKYPYFATVKGIIGTAIVQFMIDKDGTVKEVTVMRGLCHDIKAECYRIVTRMPRWTPGSVKGRPAKVRFTLPIRFRLE